MLVLIHVKAVSFDPREGGDVRLDPNSGARPRSVKKRRRLMEGLDGGGPVETAASIKNGPDEAAEAQLRPMATSFMMKKQTHGEKLRWCTKCDVQD
jgi:hypothetical protein